MKQFNEGDQRKFIEHCCIVRDIDSLEDIPFTISVAEDFEGDVEEYVERLAMKSTFTRLILAGNHGEPEYYGETGLVILAEYNGKKWIQKEILKERNEYSETMLKNFGL